MIQKKIGRMSRDLMKQKCNSLIETFLAMFGGEESWVASKEDSHWSTVVETSCFVDMMTEW